ncbi:hypothetical protein [Cyanobium sp. LEGE 06143]|uniref:hypothetical protein n=1 Tax=Cyanobium sp. LEGE 06143 TaxID=945727 RepID=UPI0018825306|nr:hypothetical protein [Cyanobium sp. LEGE 06143]
MSPPIAGSDEHIKVRPERAIQLQVTTIVRSSALNIVADDLTFSGCFYQLMETIMIPMEAKD